MSDIWCLQYTRGQARSSTARPAHARTTFCSRQIRFLARDEVVLSYTAASPPPNRVYIRAVRRPGAPLLLTARMLQAGEAGLGGEENTPPVLCSAVWNCAALQSTGHPGGPGGLRHHQARGQLY